MPQLDTLHIVLSIISLFLVILIIAKKGFLDSMKNKFVSKDIEVLTKEQFEDFCENKQKVCSRIVCKEIKILFENQAEMKLDIKAIKDTAAINIKGLKNDMAENMLEVKNLIVVTNEKISDVDRNVSRLEVNIQKELTNISKFIGAVEQHMKIEIKQKA